jgi:hypothetical protein
MDKLMTEQGVMAVSQNNNKSGHPRKDWKEQLARCI